MDRFMARFKDRWCYLSGGSQTSTQKTETDPQIKALMLGNYAKAGEVADTPFQSYTGERVAGFNPTQLQGQAGLLSAANDPAATNTLNSAKGGLLAALGQAGTLGNYQAPTIGSPGTLAARGITAGGYNPSTYNPTSYNPSTYNPTQITAPDPYSAAQLAGTDLAPYENPFTKGVIDRTISDQQYARDQQGVRDKSAATAAHAFGGSREGVQRALTTEGYDRNTGDLIAGLNSDNFNQAREGALADIGARNTAKQFNSTMDYNVRGANADILNAAGEFAAGARNTSDAFNAGSANTASQFNAGSANDAARFILGQRLAADQYNATAGTNADQFNIGTGLDIAKTNAGNDITGAGLRLSAANAGGSLASQLGQMSNQELTQALQRAGVIAGVGDAQQNQEQNVNDAAYEEFLRQLNYPIQQQNIRNTAIGLLPSDGTTTGTTQKKYGLGDFLMAGIYGASNAAAGGAFGK